MNNDNKTPEEMAEEYADDKSKAYYIGENDENKWYITPRGQYAKEDFLAGYQAGVKEAEERILNEFFDNYGADEHASFALRVNAYKWNKNDK